jgi:hydrogenase expression/formation protein HypD
MTPPGSSSDAARVAGLAAALARVGQLERTYMEVCGTHTMAVSRYGLRDLLPPGMRLVSGPGCPVCVTAGRRPVAPARRHHRHLRRSRARAELA